MEVLMGENVWQAVWDWLLTSGLRILIIVFGYLVGYRSGVGLCLGGGPYKLFFNHFPFVSGKIDQPNIQTNIFAGTMTMNGHQ